jgi:anti-sigma factor RsiW
MSTDPTPTNPIDSDEALQEQLVAYLDHELDDPSCRRIEQLLASDPKVREMLRQLERTWGSLDLLRRAEVDESFTHATLEMVAVAASEELVQQHREVRRRRGWRWLVGSAGLLTAGIAGFFASPWLWPNPDEQLLRDLPVIENLDQYRQIDDIEFLRLLYHEGLFVREDGDGA